MKKNYINFLVIFIFLLVGFFLINHNASHTTESIKYIKLAGQNIKVNLALTSQEQELGLSGRSGLTENGGMLFVFPKSGHYPFWMKDMNFPIDMIWISENLQVIYIQKNATPESYPESFGPNENAKYVLEVVSGFSDKNNLKVGNSISFTY